MSGFLVIAEGDLDAIAAAVDLAQVREIVERALGEVMTNGVLTHNRCSAVYFRAGLLACRETMARFVEQGGDASTAASIRANWWPALGVDPGRPRQLAFDELVDGGGDGPWTSRADLSASVEALPYAFAFAGPPS